MNEHFDGKYVIVENPYRTERNGQRAQVVASRDNNSGSGVIGDASNRLDALLTLRFSDGQHEDVIASSVRMSEDQTTPVWPAPVGAKDAE